MRQHGEKTAQPVREPGTSEDGEAMPPAAGDPKRPEADVIRKRRINGSVADDRDRRTHQRHPSSNTKPKG
jgi:hypothetical protein